MVKVHPGRLAAAVLSVFVSCAGLGVGQAQAAAPLTWHTWRIDHTAGIGDSIMDISCSHAPSLLCVAADFAGNVFTSRDPVAGHWTEAAGADAHGAPFGVSCAPGTAPLCVLADNNGNLATSTDPAGGASAWTVTWDGAGASLEGVSCSSSSLCVAVDGNGDVVTSTDPGGTGTWTVTPL